jgi:hypothetical protein
LFVLTKDKQGTVHWYAPSIPSATPTVIIYNKNGGTEVSSTNADYDSTSTLLTADASAGATTIAVSAPTGIATNTRFLLSLTGEYSEMVHVETVNANSLTLRSPLLHAHSSSTVFSGVKISYTIASAILDEEDMHWRAEFSWSSGGTAQPPSSVPFHISRYSVYNPISAYDVFALDPHIRDKAASSTGWECQLACAWDEVLETIVAKGINPGAVVGTNMLRRATLYRFIARLNEQYGQEYTEERDHWYKRSDELLDKFRVVGTFDKDEDGAVEEHEHGVKGGRLFRA